MLTAMQSGREKDNVSDPGFAMACLLTSNSRAWSSWSRPRAVPGYPGTYPPGDRCEIEPAAVSPKNTQTQLKSDRWASYFPTIQSYCFMLPKARADYPVPGGGIGLSGSEY
eukprot:2280002-Rhodomonas_salina.1